MSTPDLAADAVVKRFADHVAVDSLSFSVERGSFFSILGPSGCGKTTLLRMIAGFIAPDGGDISIGGKSMRDVPPNRRPVNMVFQQLALFPMMSVGENVAFGLARRGMGRAERLRRSKAMLERVGLGNAADKRVDELSGGQRQRVAIARSLVLEPTLLLLDEPLGALDLKLREHMKIELKQLQASFGTTFVYITHDQSEALVLSDHVGVMSQGRFEQLGTPQDLYYRPQTPFVAGFVGANNRIVGRTTGMEGAVAEIATADGWIVKVDLAGIEPADVQIALDGQVLRISGLRRDATCGEGISHYQLEITYSRFEKMIQFPRSIEHATIERNYHHGLLILRLFEEEEAGRKGRARAANQE